MNNNEDLIRQKIEQADPEGKISQAVVEELVESIKNDFPKVEVELTGIKEEKTFTEAIRDEMIKTDDWRVRAALAAKIISNNLS